MWELYMAQVTLYLDDDVQALMDEGARASGLSPSGWVAQLIRRQVHPQWPADILALAGNAPDFPLMEDGARSQPPDVTRIGLE